MYIVKFKQNRLSKVFEHYLLSLLPVAKMTDWEQSNGYERLRAQIAMIQTVNMLSSRYGHVQCLFSRRRDRYDVNE